MHTAALDLLGAHGPDAVTLAAVADAVGLDAGRLAARWPSGADVVASAVASLVEPHRPVGSLPPFDDLVAELLVFRRVMAHPGGAALVCAALDDARHPELARAYRDRVIRPQRTRLRRILERARAAGLVEGDDEDLDTAVSCCTGSWYALAVAGVRPPRDWGSAVARQTWRSLGGTVPA